MCRTNRWGAFKDERIDPVARPPSNKPLSLYIYIERCIGYYVHCSLGHCPALHSFLPGHLHGLETPAEASRALATTFRYKLECCIRADAVERLRVLEIVQTELEIKLWNVALAFF